MIVPMKKVAILVQDKDADSALSSLRSLGAVHVENQQPPGGPELGDLNEDINLLDTAIGILSTAAGSGSRGKVEKEPPDWKTAARHVADCQKRVEQLEGYSLNLAKTISDWEGWGDFDPEAIALLSKKNVFVKLYQLPLKERRKLKSQAIVREISVRSGIVNCALVSRDNIELPFKEIPPPRLSLSNMRKRLQDDRRIIASLKDDINKNTVYLGSFLKTKRFLAAELEFQKALKGMGKEKGFSYLVGYAPLDACAALAQKAKREKWAVMINEPSPEDKVPTLIRNPRWISIIAPVFRMIEIVPGYRELDISLWFLIFFSVFFGILIGDAGYGAVYFLLALIAQKKLGSKLKDKSVFVLFYILSLCAVAWGLLSGTVFGQAWLPEYVKPLIPALRDDSKVQSLCFLIGALHLNIAHLWRFTIKMPSLSALAELGWALILWVAFFLARTLILSYPFPAFATWFLIGGVGLVLLFSSPQKNILKGIGASLGVLLLNLVNNFTDIVSYIRLFAVGLATVAIADAFNAMALGIGYNNIFSGVATSLILVLGHLLNIILGPLSMLVHGVRLNILEFSSHLDVKWSGIVYRPLRENAKD